MLYIAKYGCVANNVEQVIEAKTLREAESWVYNAAVEEYDSYAGLHGIPSLEEVCEEQGIEDTDSAEAEEAYCQERESWLDYSIEVFDPENEEHQDIKDFNGVVEV